MPRRNQPSKIVMVRQRTNHDSDLLSNLLKRALPSCEMLSIDLGEVDAPVHVDQTPEVLSVLEGTAPIEPVLEPAQESQQIEEHHRVRAEDQLVEKLKELALDQRYTGGHHVYMVSVDGDGDTVDPIQQGMLKAMLEQAMTEKSEVSAVLLPAEGEDITGDALDQFAEEAASLETLCAPFGIRVYRDIASAAAAISR